MINRSQALVLGFFAAAWLVLLAILLRAPAIYASALKPPLPTGRSGAIILMAFLTLFLVALAIGVIRRWRWMFWLIVIAFLAGALRVPASLLQLSGDLPTTGPAWYEILQAVIGLVQVVIGVALIAGYRKSGPWGSF